jgi:hypothetical protein
MTAGGIQGVVRDETGVTVGGVNIVALGTTLASAQSDSVGRFSLRLPPGEYILRASHRGYVSTFREPIRVQSSIRLDRDITLVRLDAAGEMLLASAPGAVARQPGPLELLPADRGDHSHSILAWRLRHLRRSVLRETAPSAAGIGDEPSSGDLRPHGSFLENAFYGSARVASAFFTETDFTGQINFLTSGLLSQTSAWRPQQWSRGIAYAAVGAPVGAYGDWRVRGAVNAGDLSSWVFLGEYRARAEMTHAVHAGMSYGVQGDLSASITRRGVGVDSRSVGAVFVYDRWRVRPGVELEFGARADHYDYVTRPDLISPRLGARVEVSPGTRVVVQGAQYVVAPGATEFLPPTSGGLWLPPERTFSTLSSRSTLRAERVRRVDVGLERDLGGLGRPATLSVRHFLEASRDQVATLFHLRAANDAGHYRVATPGDVRLEGWAFRRESYVWSSVRASVDDAVASAEWTSGRDAARLGRVAPSVLRVGTERIHDVTMSVEADIPESDTRVSLAYRVSSAFSGATPDGLGAGLAGRFDVEVHQALPYRPLPGSRLELLFAVRNLHRDPGSEGSMYDELLTTAPPLRLMGGVRVRF